MRQLDRSEEPARTDSREVFRQLDLASEQQRVYFRTLYQEKRPEPSQVRYQLRLSNSSIPMPTID